MLGAGELRLTLLSRLQHQQHGERRNALLRWAMIGSASSKVSGLALQAIAIPLVYHSLGQHRFALYLLLTAALAAMSLAQMGAGPGLTQALARANAARRRDDEASLLNAAFRLTGAGAVIGGSVILLVIHVVEPDRLFGAAFANDRLEILNSANVCVFILMAQMISGVVDSALAGYQEQVLSSMASMVGNLISVGLLILVCRHSPTIIGVVVVLFGVPTLSRASNLVALYLRRPYLLHGVMQSSRGFYAPLLNVGLAFWTIELCSLLAQNGGTFVLARLSSTHDTDLFAIVYRYLALASSAVNVITQPLWPAITDAIAHRDTDWIRRSYARIMRALSIYSGLLAIIAMSAGPWIFQHILHVDTAGYYWLFFILGFYFVANIWTHLLYITMMGMPGIWRAAAVLLSENLLMLLFALVLVPNLGAAGMALAYLAASVTLPVWLLPRLMKQELERISATHVIAG
jgi:O-antigen/teichoic acid export membrane protein